MKSSILKRVLSVVLALMLVVGTLAISFTSVAAADTTDTKTVYVGVVEHITGYVPMVHYWNSSGLANDAELKPVGAQKKYSVGSAYWSNAAQNFIIYKAEIPTAATTFKVWNPVGNQWPDAELTYTSGKIALFWEYSNAVHNKFDTYTPVADVTPSETKKTIYFLDGTSNSYITENDAKMFVYTNAGDKAEMTETVDTVTGKALWYAEIDEAATNVNFYRTSYYYDVDNAYETQWGIWSAGDDTTSVYKATASATGSWVADDTVVAPSGDIADFAYGMWIDSVGLGDAQHAIRWYKDTTGYELYVPSYVDLTQVNVYTSYDSFKIDDVEYANGDAVNLTTGSHNFKSIVNGTTTDLGTLTVYQTVDTAAMLMTTNEELFTGLTAANYGTEDAPSNAWPAGSGINETNFNGVYKDAIETKGTYYMVDEEGNQIVGKNNKIKKIKGRGNSSFEASMRLYGKYAYNINLDKKAGLIDGAEKSKKWCMLANNVDHSMMRNTFAYELADMVGIKYGPETRLVDVYDNGKYLGAYVITEKVEYGEDTLMADMANLDDGIEDVNMTAYGYDEEDYPAGTNEYAIEDLMDYVKQVTDEFEVNGKTYTYAYTDFDREAIAADYPELADKGLSAEDIEYLEPEDFNEYNYLLEFELQSRYEAEACWFVSPRTKQAVVCKYPETASQDVMKWVISEYEAAEAAIYEGVYADIANVLDVDSFVKMYLIQELALNLDSAATSYYVHNEVEFDADGNRTGSKLVSSPVWDYDWSFGSHTGTKFVYNDTSTVDSKNVANPEAEMTIKNKALKTDAVQTASDYVNNYNFQAKLVHNETVWERCQYIWSNEFSKVLPQLIDNDYIDADPQADDGVTEGKLLAEWLPKFESSVEMNEARWDCYDGYDGTTLRDTWGTKVTSDYVNRSFNFYPTNAYSSYKSAASASTATKSYANTVYYLNDWLVKRWNYMSSEDGGQLYNEDLVPTYVVENVDFKYDQSTDKSTVAVKPVAEVTYGCTAEGFETVAEEELQYNIYLNGELYGTYKYVQEVSVSLVEDMKNELYIEVFPTADPEKAGKSDSQYFSYGYVPVEVTVYFKSSDSYRYTPKLSVNGGTAVTMTKPDSKDDAISHNASRTQYYYWYSTTVTLDSANATTLQFNNAYSMRATATLSGVQEGDVYYFGCDNLNNGNTAVNLTDASEGVRNFVKSATHMVANDAEAAGLATTSLDGTIYKLGDTDGDDTLSILDATTIQLALVEKTDLDETQTALADYDLDEVTSIVDATMIQRYLVNN